MREVTMVDLKCTRCGKSFQRKPYRIKKSKNKFCSHSCQVRYGTEQVSKNSKVECSCSNCKSTFYTSRIGLKRRNKKYGVFCSKKCYYEFIKGWDFSTYVDLVCAVCGKSFTRLRSIERANRKQFTKICCSRACSSIIQHQDPNYIKHRLFYQLAQAIRSRETIEVGEDVDEEYLLGLWDAQKGLCPYTGYAMELKTTRNRGKKIPYQVSIDRIDSSKGYIRGNIEFISLMANLAKNTWNKEDVIDFCKKVAKNA